MINLNPRYAMIDYDINYVKTTVAEDNYMIQYIYYILDKYMTLSLDELLQYIENLPKGEQYKINLEMFNIYNNLLLNASQTSVNIPYLLKIFNNLIKNIIVMDI